MTHVYRGFPYFRNVITRPRIVFDTLNLFKNNSTVLWSLSTVDSTSRYIFCNNLFYTYQLMGKHQQKNYQDSQLSLLDFDCYIDLAQCSLYLYH